MVGRLGVFEITASTIMARLTNAAEAGQYVVADAVRVEWMGDSPQKTTVYVEGEDFESSTYQPHYAWYSNSCQINWTLMSPGVAGVTSGGFASHFTSKPSTAVAEWNVNVPETGGTRGGFG